ncbi:MAG: hypothetical protein NC177_13380 [Ruminococcus flavefaciens]|nr:hypothetical protein [Ruminococcus flavefaciens]
MESDFSRFIKLKDICEVEISQELCPAEKKREYIRQTGSSTNHKVGDVEVECVYGSMKLEKMLADIICE